MKSEIKNGNVDNIRVSFSQLKSNRLYETWDRRFVICQPFSDSVIILHDNYNIISTPRNDDGYYDENAYFFKKKFKDCDFRELPLGFKVILEQE